jgi:hypothetical protein
MNAVEAEQREFPVDLLKVGDLIFVQPIGGYKGAARVEKAHRYSRGSVEARMINGKDKGDLVYAYPYTSRPLTEEEKIGAGIDNDVYDSRMDTILHIGEVRDRIDKVILALKERQKNHDLSKLEEPEKSVFDEYTPKLKSSTYGSEEYEQYRREMSKALDHHYANNSHHPEYYPERDSEDLLLLESDINDLDWAKISDEVDNEGKKRILSHLRKTLHDSRSRINGMDLLDIVEMLCDWKAATLRHADGDLRKSIEINQDRFGYSDQMKNILNNTAERLGFFTK